MKKSYMLLIFIFLFAFFSQWANAITSDFKDVYAPRETVIGKLSGSILQPISPLQIKLKKGYQEVPFEYGIKKLNGNYYVWLIAPQTQANYTLLIEDIISSVGGAPTVIDYEKNFAVQGALVDYNIKPGLIFAVEDFSIEAKLFENSPKNIELSFPTQRQITLNPGVNYIDFSIESVVGNQFVNIIIGKYTVPAYIVGKEVQTGSNETNVTMNISGPVCGNNIIELNEQCELGIALTATCNALNLGQGNLSCYAAGHQYECKYNTSGCQNGTGIPPQGFGENNCENISGTCKTQCSANETTANAQCENLNEVCCVLKQIQIIKEKPLFQITPQIIESTVLVSNELPTYLFNVKNLGNFSIKNIGFNYNRNLFRIASTNVTIEPNSTARFNLTLKGNNTKEIREVVWLDIEGERKYLLVKIGFTTNEQEINTSYLRREENRSSLYYCSDLGGILCTADEVCEGETFSSIESGQCCIGQCESSSKEGSKAWIGYLIAAIVVLALLVVYVKYKKVKPEAKPLAKV